MALFDNEVQWEDSAPAELHTAIKHLRDLFHEGHWKCRKTTEVFCYSLLHEGDGLQEVTKEYLNPLQCLKGMVGKAAAQRFDALIKEQTPSSTFKAFFDLYLDAMTLQAVDGLKQLNAMGAAKEPLLKMPYMEWAELQTKHMIRSTRHKISSWVRDVCDKHAPSESDDPDEIFFWRNWQAPKFLMMKPALHFPFEEDKILERLDAELSLRLLTQFENAYVIHLEMTVKRVAGSVALAVAKQPAAAHDISGSQGAGASVITAEARLKQSTGGREAGKLKTQARYKQWQKEYMSLKRKHPEKSIVWCSLQIAKLPIANGRDASTIKKHMLR